MLDEELEFLKLIAVRLESAGIPYMLTGSMAMAVYTIPRMTRDIDVVIEYTADQAERVANALPPQCHVDVESVRQAAMCEDMFSVVHSEWIIKADFIVRKSGVYRALEFQRRRTVELQGTHISVVSPEDLILSKLLWARESESEMQLRDVRQLIALTEALDLDYVDEWAEKLGVRQLLERARAK